MNAIMTAPVAPAIQPPAAPEPPAGSRHVHFELTPAGFQWYPAQLDGLNRVTVLLLVEILNQYASYRSF